MSVQVCIDSQDVQVTFLARFFSGLLVGLAFELKGVRGAGVRGDLRMASFALGLAAASAIFLGRPRGRLGAFLIALASSAALAFLEGILVR